MTISPAPSSAAGMKAGLAALAAGEAQEVLGDAAAADQLLAGDGGAFVDAHVGWGIAQDAFHAHQYRCQRRIEFVRETGSEYADRGEAVGFSQVGFRRATLRDIAPDLDYVRHTTGTVEDR